MCKCRVMCTGRKKCVHLELCVNREVYVHTRKAFRKYEWLYGSTGSYAYVYVYAYMRREPYGDIRICCIVVHKKCPMCM